MRFVDVAGAQVSYKVDGSGPGLLLVSGTGGTLESNWAHLVDGFARHRTVVRADYSGSGDTLDQHEQLSVELLAEQIVAAARAADAAPFDLVGFSLGACVSVHIAAHYPELVRSLVLLGGFVSGDDARLQLQSRLWLDLIRSDPRTFARLVLLTGFSPEFLSGLSGAQIDEWIEGILSMNKWDGIARQIELDRTLDISEQAKRIKTPTLVIGCSHDNMVPVRHSRALASMIPDARYAELPSGHLAPFELPDEFSTLVMDFISGAGDARS